MKQRERVIDMRASNMEDEKELHREKEKGNGKTKSKERNRKGWKQAHPRTSHSGSAFVNSN